MRAMVMAAGKGTRLRPVTDLVPKPMAPVANRPVLDHILRLLKRHGITEVVLNLHHLPETITDYLGDGSALGLDVRYSPEPELLGTAGGVKKNEDFLGTGTFLIMSGDALTDIDLTGLLAAHRRNGSIATIAVKEVDDPSQYGVVVTDDDNRVLGFQEKPSREEARSHLCNCGIYIFEPEIFALIPAGQFDDFGSRLFPDMLKQGVPFHAHTFDGYWSDVGNLSEFFRGNADALTGRVELELPGQEVRPGVWVDEGAVLADSVRLEPPVVIGKGCSLGEGVVVEGPAVLGDRTVAGAGAHIVRAIVLPDSQVPAGSVIVEGIVGQKLGLGHEASAAS
jgi:mannose-1-phosphate guanylyltransferase